MRRKAALSLSNFAFIFILINLSCQLGGAMQVPRWRNILILRNSFSPSSNLASFHSTTASLEKWKNKWNSDAGRSQQPSKNYIRYATRQKRSDARKALKNLLYKSGSSKLPFQDENLTWNNNSTSSWNVEQDDNLHTFKKQSQSMKSSAKATARCSTHAGKGQYNGGKRKLRRESFSDDFDEDPETVFQATFGSKCYTWSFRSAEDSCFRSSTGFEWRDHSNWRNYRREEWKTASETDDDDNSCIVGSHSDRKILGLPTTGPLKIEDVKSAFRMSALRWHPDKHQGPSQAMAEEKFKLCVDAYKSLCNALS